MGMRGATFANSDKFIEQKFEKQQLTQNPAPDH